MEINDSIFFIYERNYKHAYPRGSLRLYPIVARKGGEYADINNREEATKFCYLNIDVFMNLFSEDQKKSKVYDCIFLDIDDKNLQKSFTMLIKVLHKLNKAGIENYHVMFSGSKGFHVYVPFDDIFLSNYRIAVIGWIKSIGIVDYIDTSAIEPNRVTRVIGSINSKSGRKCMYLGTSFHENDWNLEDIILKSNPKRFVGSEQSWTPNVIWKNKIPQLKDFDREGREFKGKSNQEMVVGIKSNMFKKPDHYPECMRILFNEAMDGTDLGHLERLELGKFMLHVTGGNMDIVKKLYSKMSDYNESKTTYNLKYIIRRDLKLLGCEKMMIEGLCPYNSKLQAEKECPFYPSINKFITIERKKQHVEQESKSMEDFVNDT